jgi:alginate O-acetyltransferase complex protein AlgI
MLFNSFEFLFVFLPLTCIFFFYFGKRSQFAGKAMLTFASLFFYCWWKFAFLKVLLISMIFNFLMAGALVRARDEEKKRKTLLRIGVGVNLLALVYFKYSGFLVSNVGYLFGKEWSYSRPLPLGISFFTFTQIAYLVDLYRNEAQIFKPIDYGLFVTYFPHLISGPILHHSEMLPQFKSKFMYRFRSRNLAVGLTIFALGLFKKVVLADSVATFVGPVFSGHHLSFVEAWGGALAYTLQIYFDFSGYSDMAVGLSRMLGVQLPINFNSPYQSQNIIHFWRRWHITLSRFLRDYLYIPLGGSRKGPARRYVNLSLTMLLGGLWHGAGWTFVIWGALHGLYLVINHGWQKLRGAAGKMPSALSKWIAHKITFIAVVFAWIFFRATSLKDAG